MRRGVLVVSCCLAGCTDDRPFDLIVNVGDHVIASVQDGDGPWVAVEPGRTRRVRVEITSGRYGIAYFCDGNAPGNWHPLYVYRSTMQDEANTYCGDSSTPVTLSGQTAPMARVHADSSSAPAIGGAYSMSVRPGTHDVFAMLAGEPALLLAVRDVVISRPTTLDLPVLESGTPMPLVSPVITGASELPTVYTTLETMHGDWMRFATDPTTVVVPPAELLRATDRAVIGAWNESCVVETTVGPEVPVLSFPAPLVAELDRQGARWVADPALDPEFLHLRIGNEGETVYTAITATREWVEASGNELSIPERTLLPGWYPELSGFRDGEVVNWSVFAWRGGGEGYRECWVSGSQPW